MLNHSKSFLLSLIIHILILLSLFAAYKYFFKTIEPSHNIQKICIQLACISEQEVKQKEVPQIKQEIIKPNVKKIIKKTKVIKKKSIKNKEKIIKKVATISKPKKLSRKVEQKKEFKSTAQPINKAVVEKKPTDKERYLKDNLSKIAELIKESLYYPRRARKRGIEGTVTVRFILHTDSTVTQITTTSSTSGILTRAAIKTIAELSGKFPKPSKELLLNVPITYSLH